MRAPSRLLLFAALTTLACSAPAPAPAGAAPPTTSPPPPSPVTVTVVADAPGRSAADVERDVAVPLEQALSGVAGLTGLRSESHSDGATLVLTLAPGPVAAARSAVLEGLVAARRALPSDVAPALAPDLAPAAAVRFVLGGALPATELHALAQRLRDDLARIPGVGAIELCGGRAPQLQIALDPGRVAAYGLTLAAIVASVGAGLEGDARPAPGLQARLAARSLADLEALVIKPGEPPVTLTDVATLRVGAGPPACDAAEVGAGAVVLGTVLPRREVDASFQDAVQGRLTAAQSELPVGVALRVPSWTRVTLELQGEVATVPVAARELALALKGARRAYLQADTGVPPGGLVTADLLLEPGEPADGPALVAALAALPGVKLRASAGDELARVTVLGDELATATRVADELASLARKLPGTLDVAVRRFMAPEVAIEVQRERLARFGVADAELRAVLVAAVAGVTVGALSLDGASLPVRLQLGDMPAGRGARVELLGALQVQTASGPVPLSELVTLRLEEQPYALLRLDRRRAVEVELRLADAAARAAVQAAVNAELRLPPGYLVRFE